jgi:fermentation-respiration switch protein FrsA (DUF1100 family)
MIAIILAGCMSLDSFFYTPDQVDTYDLDLASVPTYLQELTTLVSEDDLTLWGLWAWQPDRVDAPTLLFHHGNSAQLAAYGDRVELYWSWGWNVFIYDYRGYGRSEGTPEHDGVIADARAASRQAAAALNREVGDIASLGVSLGGFAGLHAAMDEVPCAVVTEDTFSSAEGLLLLNTGLDLPAGWFFVDPYDNEAAAAHRGDVPLLVVHGENDAYIPVAHSERIMTAAAEPKTRWVVPDGEHGQDPWIQPEDYEDQVRGFIEQSCGWNQ